MPIVIDGYNLLHASVISSHPRGRTELERARLGLLNFLAETIDAATLPQTTVVFDSADAPPGLPDMLTHAGMTIRFARHYTSADEMIEHLIETCTNPRTLTVVSSDHRIHRAAKRRKSTPIDSDRWLSELIRIKNTSATQSGKDISKPSQNPTASEVAYWIERFTKREEP